MTKYSNQNIREVDNISTTNKTCRICYNDERDDEKGQIPINVCNCKGKLYIFIINLLF